jgi:hypothetical protein
LVASPGHPAAVADAFPTWYDSERAIWRRRGSDGSGNLAKFWLDPVRLERSHGFRRNEINRVHELVEEHRERLLEGWNEFFHG